MDPYALIVFAQHHVHADRDIASMASLRMLSKDLTANIDSKYPEFVSDLIALKAARVEAEVQARGDAMIAAFDAAIAKAVHPHRFFSLFDAIRDAGLLNARKRPWDADLRPRMVSWLYEHFGQSSGYLYDIMHALKYRPVWVVKHEGPVPTRLEVIWSRFVMPDDVIPGGAVRAPFDYLPDVRCQRREYFLRVAPHQTRIVDPGMLL
jgi:hypothetical protein